MKNIKPIETIYNGYKFRSRLEARWAVFFDELGIQYEYELEGFELPNGLRYLPDFYLSDLNIYVEVKPSIELMNTKDLEKIFGFTHKDSNKSLLLIIGTPTKQNFYFLNNSFYYFDEFAEELECYNDYNIIQHFSDYLLNIDAEVEFAIESKNNQWIIIRKDFEYGYHFQNLALNKAKQARFEFKDKK